MSDELMENPSDQNLDLMILLDHTTRNVLRAREIELNQYGLTPVQARVLYILTNIEGGMMLSEITKTLSREPHSVSELIKRMEKNGLVKKVKVPPGRTIKVYITAKGRQVYGRSNRRAIGMVFSKLTEREKRQLGDILNKLRHESRELLGLDHKPPFLE